MTHIPVIVKVVDDVVPSGSVDKEAPDLMGKITSCFNCGGLLFYQLITTVEDTENATDTCIYCAVCGQMQHGFISDPFDELESLRAGTEWWHMLDWNTMPKAWEQLSPEIKEKIREAGLAPKEAED